MKRDARWRLAAALVSIAFAVTWTLLQGKALHWDAVNYHFYLGFAALNDRFPLDFFAAGTPSYINPYAYIPLHLLTSAGLPAVLVATILSAVHGLIFWLTYELTLVVSADASGRDRQAFALLAIVFAAMGPVLLQGLGMTLVDIPLGALVVASWLALASTIKRGQLAWVAAAGALGGVAAALKLSNAFYAVAALSMVLFFPGNWKRRLQAGALYCAACGCAFLAVSGPWSYQLWLTFGNPVFPFMNEIFRSPDFTSAPLRYERFRPASAWEFFARPFDMLSPLSRQNTEGRAPDVRFAVLFVALALASVPAVLRLAGRNPSGLAPDRRPDGNASRVLVALALAFVIAWCLWLGTSSNSRYFIPMACVGSVLLAALLQRAYRRWKDATTVAILLIVLAQAVQIAMGADWKRGGATWEGPYLQMRFPDRLRDEPHLFLSTSFLSGSAFLPVWHRDSGMITVAGFYALGPERPGWARAQQMIARNADRLRILTLLPLGVDETTGLPGPASDLDTYVRRFGLAVDGRDCEFVKLQSNLVDESRTDVTGRWTNWVTCKLRADPEGAQRYAREVREVDIVFDRVEAACPNLFHPPRPVTEQHPNWTRLYNMGSEQQLWIANGRLLYRTPLLGGDPIDLGDVEAWSRAPQAVDCSRKFAPAFGLIQR